MTSTVSSPEAPPAGTPPRRRRLWRRVLLVVALLCGLHLAAWQIGLTKITTPGDVVLNLGSASSDPALAAPRDGARHLVAVLHGLGRSSWSMWKLERLLENHGYEVWNETYDGAAAGLIDLGADFGERLEAHLAATADGRPLELYAAAHSMGGLVLRSYLRRPGSRAFRAIVLLGTPNRGATLATQLRDSWYFSFFLGSRAARDLSPETGVIDELGPAPPHLGNVIGAVFDGEGRSPRIPGDDDGRVGVSEAHLEGETDAILLDLSHTFLPTADAAHHQVLFFLSHQRFDR